MEFRQFNKKCYPVPFCLWNHSAVHFVFVSHLISIVGTAPRFKTCNEYLRWNQ